MRNVFPDKLRRLPYQLRKLTKGSGWLVKEGPNEKSVDRLYPTVGAMVGSGGDPQTDYEDSKVKQGALEESFLNSTIPHRFQPDGWEGTLDTLSGAFIQGFLDELEKDAASGSTIERIADMVKDVKERAVAGHKARGIVGAAGGVERGLRANPWLWMAPAGAYAGYRLIKGILNIGKEQQQ